MRGITYFSEKPEDYVMGQRGNLFDLWIRMNAAKKEDEEGNEFWQADEAYMILSAESDEIPSKEVLEAGLKDWFEYASEWESEKPNTMEQLRADVDYILTIMEG